MKLRILFLILILGHISLPVIAFGGKDEKIVSALNRLKEFCSENNFHCIPDSVFIKKISILEDPSTSPVEQYELENNITERLTLEETTMLEYYYLDFKSNRYLHYNPLEISMSRILDKVYSANWEKVTSNEKWIRLYLKKAEIFRNIGYSGAMNRLLRKFKNSQPSIHQRLVDLFIKEKDIGIRLQILEILSDEKQLDQSSVIKEYLSLHRFLNYEASKQDALLPFMNFKKTDENYNEIAGKLQKAEDKYSAGILMRLLLMNADKAMIPAVITILKEPGIEGEIEVISYGSSSLIDLDQQDMAVAILEELNNHSFDKLGLKSWKSSENKIKIKGGKDLSEKGRTAKDWLHQYEKTEGRYEEWESLLVKEKMNSQNLTSHELNWFSYSTFYTKELWKKQLQKISEEEFASVYFPEKITDAELKELSHYINSGEALIKILNNAEVTDTIKFLKFINDKLAMLPSGNGELLYRLFVYTNFREWLKADKHLTIIPKQFMIDELAKFLEANDNEYRGNHIRAAIFYLDFIDQSFDKRLSGALDIIYPKVQKIALEKELLEINSYDQLKEILKNHELLGLLLGENTLFDYFTKDLGLFTTREEEDIEIINFAENYADLSEKGLYNYYANRFYPDILKGKNQLNYELIYDILKYDVCGSFIGSSNEYGDQIYPVIRLLEMKHNTRLGYPYMFNHTLTGIAWSKRERTRDWMDYLRENRLVDVSPGETASFND